METPEDFLELVKIYFKYAPEIEFVKSEAFTELNRKEFEAFEGDLKTKLENYTIESDEIVLSLMRDVLKVLTTEEINQLEKVAFGKIQNTTVNAFCIKSNDGLGNYCIVINEGLLMLLHKQGKLRLASSHPDYVIFCNRGDHKKIRPKLYLDWANELIDNYKKNNAPQGAMIKLNSDGNVAHGISLHVQELFILCHELGHFYNGDLEESSNVSNLIKTNWSVVDENKDHEIEFKADLTGFDMLIKVIKHRFNLDEKYALIQVAIVFDVLAKIDPNPSEDHPAPIDRMCNIISSFWGEKFAESYIKTYSDDVKFSDFYDSLK